MLGKVREGKGKSGDLGLELGVLSREERNNHRVRRFITENILYSVKEYLSNLW